MSNISITISNLGVTEAAELLARLQGSPVAVTEAPKAAPRTRKAPEAAPAPAAAPVAAPKAAAPAAAPAAGEALKKQAIAKLVTLINANDALGRNGKQVCTDLCLTFGGANISKIAPEKYPDVIAAVETALEELNSDPTA